MKRLTKFYDDHKDYVVAGLGGLLVAVSGLALIQLKMLEKQKICCGGMREGSDGSIFDVYLKSNDVVSFYKPDKDWPQI